MTPAEAFWDRTYSQADFVTVKRSASVTTGQIKSSHMDNGQIQKSVDSLGVTSQMITGQKMAGQKEEAASQNRQDSEIRNHASKKYLGLAGQKYNWYMQELRAKSHLERFEESRRVAATKVRMYIHVYVCMFI